MSTAAAHTRTDSTPILDRQAPLPQPAAGGLSPRLLRRLSLGLGIALALLVLSSVESRSGWVLSHYTRLFPGEWTGARVLYVGFSLLAVVPVAIAVHEVGHVLGGLLAGFRFSTLRIGPLQIDRPLRISLQRASGAGYAGWASMHPTRRDRLRQRALLLVFAGPAASLLSAGAVLLLSYPKGFFSELFLAVSLFLGLKELVPIRHRIAIPDGWRLRMLLRDREASRRWLALLHIDAELNQGLLPESWASEILAEAVALRDDSPDTLLAHALAYSAAFHRHADDEAGRMLEICLQHANRAVPLQREALMSDAAVFQARRRRRADLAEQWLADMPQSTRSPWLRARAEAAILEARGDGAGALKKLEVVERAYLAQPDRVRRTLFLRLLERWRSELSGR